MSEHEWFHDHLTLYTGGGLSADEASRLERHAADCAACAQEFAQWRLFDQGLDRLCTPVQFAADWDERVLAKWRVTHKPPRRWSAPVRWAAAAAAMILIGALGASVMAVAEQGMVAFPGGESVRGQANLPPVLPVLKLRSYFGPALTQSSNSLKQPSGGGFGGGGFGGGGFGGGGFGGGGVPPAVHASNGTNVDIQNANSIDFFPPSLALIVRGDSKVHTSISGGVIGGKHGKIDGATHHGHNFHVTQDVAGKSVPDGGTVAMGGLGKRLDDLQKLQDGEMKSGLTVDNEESKDLLAAEKEAHAGTYYFRAGPKSLLPSTPPVATVDNSDSNTMAGRSALTTPATETPPVKVGQIFLDGKDDEKNKDKSPESKSGKGGSKHSSTVLKSTTEYYSLSGGSSESVRVLALQPATTMLPDPKGEQPKAADEDPSVPGAAKPQEAVGIQAVAQPKPDPQVAQRKIIRTGDLEFEVDLFDNAVNQITKLIGAIPGAFVMTVNSDRLPNGKVKGAVVVRMPPEHLDKFVLDLRKDLAKTGELKSQRIGSQDVTKQYTDIESRLRAARAMEERLIKIITNGKGEIKDLVAAERELGVWRTKIEEYEGEIRYYNNQVGLSTLTITAFEKEIRTAAAMVVTEQVTMKIEADDVEKSLQTALTAVTEAKGRVIKSELKQHAAGQLEAVLQFEVAPPAAGPMKDKLRQLGIVTHQDSQRLQQAEGGAAPMGEPIKSRTNDVQFNVTLYNVANIKPRQEFNLQIAVADVAAEYQRLLELVLQSSGQIRVSQLDEKDKTNIFAQLDFDVPSTKRELFDKQLAALGDVVGRNTTRAGPGETATDRKVGYRLTLKSVMSIPPRETFVLQAYSLDVPAAFKSLHEAARAKGTVRVTQLNEQDKQNIIAQLDFDVPTTEQAAVDKMLDDLGEVHSRTSNRVPPNEVATDKKVGYRLTLRSQIPPRETVALGLEVSDVERVAADLANLVGAAKGKVTISQITQDAAGRAVAIQLFDVPLSAKDNLVKKFKVNGKVRAQKITQNLQAPEGKLATAHIDVTLTNLTPIVPADESLWGQIRTSLGYAFRLLSVSLMFVIVGISVILPWALLLWAAVKLARRARGKSQAAA